MSLFDFFFPEEAQATHLRRLADSTAQANMQTRINRARQEHRSLTENKRVKELESDVAQLTILVEALLERLEEKNNLTRAELAQKIAEIDARDGVIDGRITKPIEVKKPPFKPRLHIPES